jgi:hypothetical protein
MPESVTRSSWILGMIGAVVGGAIGVIACWLVSLEDFQGLVLPGAGLGLGCGALSGHKSNGLGAVCAIAAVPLEIVTEWWLRAFLFDDSLSYFVGHLQDLRKTTLVSIALGALFGFWFGRGREGGAWLRRRPKT